MSTVKVSIIKVSILALSIMLIIGIYLNANQLFSEKKLPVTIAVSRTPLSAPFYVAEHIKAFKPTCASVKFTEVNGGVDAFSQLMEQRVDFATSSNSVMAFQYLQKQHFVSHAVFAQSDNDVKLITHRDNQINTAAQLKGKRIGVIKESASEYFLTILLALEGLSINEVTLVNYSPAQLPGALQSQKVDAIIPWEPFAFQTKRQGADSVVVHDTKGLNALSFNLLSRTADHKLVQKAKCVLEGINRAMDYIAAHPVKSKNIVLQALNLEQSFLDWVWTDYIFRLSLNNSLIQDIKSQSDWIIASQQLSDPPSNIIKLVDTRALLQVDPQTVNIQH